MCVDRQIEYRRTYRRTDGHSLFLRCADALKNLPLFSFAAESLCCRQIYILPSDPKDQQRLSPSDLYFVVRSDISPSDPRDQQRLSLSVSRQKMFFVLNHFLGPVSTRDQTLFRRGSYRRSYPSVWSAIILVTRNTLFVADMRLYTQLCRSVGSFVCHNPEM